MGHFALRCLRIEKFIPFWGEEITGDTTPNEVNRAYKVKFDKQYFIGKMHKKLLINGQYMYGTIRGIYKLNYF